MYESMLLSVKSISNLFKTAVAGCYNTLYNFNKCNTINKNMFNWYNLAMEKLIQLNILFTKTVILALY